MMRVRRRLLQRTLGGNVTSRCLARRELASSRRLGPARPRGARLANDGRRARYRMPVAMLVLAAHRRAARVGRRDRLAAAARLTRGGSRMPAEPPPLPPAFRVRVAPPNAHVQLRSSEPSAHAGAEQREAAEPEYP